MLGVCGYGYTGSGAVLDLLKEYDGTSVCDNIEFDLTYMPDGIEDLYYHLCESPTRYLSSNMAIKRYIRLIRALSSPRSVYMLAFKGEFKKKSMEYLNSLIQVRWRGMDCYEALESSFLSRTFRYRIGGRLSAFFEKILKRKVSFFTYSPMYLSITPDDFVDKSKQYLLELVQCMEENHSKILVLNQPFPSNCVENHFKYFENPHAIIVDKDPRDMYILAKEYLLSKGSFIPTDNVWDFVVYYKKIHEYKYEENNVTKIQFEDLIYKYDETINFLEKKFMLGNHINKKNYFKPEISICNTQLFVRCPKYEEDIKVIERELHEWLYPFDEKIEANTSQKVF